MTTAYTVRNPIAPLSGRVTKLAPQVHQLDAILLPHACLEDRTLPTGYVFPSDKADRGIWADARKTLNAVARESKMDPGLVLGRPLRTTYVTHRLQTMDRGEQVSFHTVAGECGHSAEVSEKVYARHLEHRWRGEEVAYRAAVADWRARGCDAKVLRAPSPTTTSSQ